MVSVEDALGLDSDGTSAPGRRPRGVGGMRTMNVLSDSRAPGVVSIAALTALPLRSPGTYRSAPPGRREAGGRGLLSSAALRSPATTALALQRAAVSSSLRRRSGPFLSRLYSGHTPDRGPPATRSLGVEKPGFAASDSHARPYPPHR